MKSRTVSIIKVCFFTPNAETVYKKLQSAMPEIFWVSAYGEKTDLWLKDAFEKSIPVLFICASGIAVRMIAPFVKDKFTDSPVIAMDEKESFVIPLLSGHLGNANEIARFIARKINAQPVITTATDLCEKFSIDNFAKANGFKIVNREKIKEVAKAVLAEKPVKIWIDSNIAVVPAGQPQAVIIEKNGSAAKADVVIGNEKTAENFAAPNALCLVPKKLCVGIGCKKGKTFEEIYSALNAVLAANKFGHDDIFSISSIDLKMHEPGLMELGHFLHVPFVTYSAEELQAAEGDFSASDFVKDVTGVSNVCERAALLCAGNLGRIVVKKHIFKGITVAVAERQPCINTWESK